MAASLAAASFLYWSKEFGQLKSLGWKVSFRRAHPHRLDFCGRHSNGVGKRQSQAAVSSAMARPAIQAY